MKKCALVIGHKKASPGAVNPTSGTTEFVFNEKLAMDIEEQAKGVYIQRVYRRTQLSLPGDINDFDPDFVVSLHCNAHDRTASGSEVLYHHRSVKGREIAEILLAQLVAALGLRSRGIKPKTAEDRGGFLLKETKAPCIIAEPFFIDNDNDLEAALSNRDALVKAYAFAIEAIAEIV